jgi:hypothetical protein
LEDVVSSTNRAAERQPDDFYATPAWATRAILPHLRGGLLVLDPFAGKGAILDVAKVSGKWKHTEGVEIDPGRADVCVSRGHAVRTHDALAAGFSWDVHGQTILTNPPFSRAMDCVERALGEIGDGECAFLLPLGWISSAARAKFHRSHPADIFVLPRRPSFCAAIACKTVQGKRQGCGWRIVQELETPRPKTCHGCGLGGLTVTTSDSQDYGFWVWGLGRGNRWFILDVAEAA